MFVCYSIGMIRNDVKAMVDRVLSWPPEDQEKFARFVTEFEEWREGDDVADLGRART
jgi:hypothetical protein